MLLYRRRYRCAVSAAADAALRGATVLVSLVAGYVMTADVTGLTLPASDAASDMCAAHLSLYALVRREERAATAAPVAWL